LEDFIIPICSYDFHRQSIGLSTFTHNSPGEVNYEITVSFNRPAMNLRSSWKEISKPTIVKSVPTKLHYLFTELQIFTTHKTVYFILSTVRKSNPTERFTFIKAWMFLSLPQGKIPALLLSFFQPEYSEYILRIFVAFIL